MTPGLRHEMPLEMITRRPGFALELLAWGLRGNVDDYYDPCHESVELNERLPTEYAADAVISVKGGDGRKRYIIVEVQRSHDKRKVWSWAAYVGGLMGRHESAVMLVVVCADRTTADKYKQPITPEESCLILCPVIVGPDELPVLRDPEDILASPEIATLSAIAHHDDMDVVTSVAVTLAESGDDRGLIYYDYLRGQLPEEIRARLEESMINTAPRLPDRFTKPIEDAAEARGLARGLARGEGKALLFVIETRGVKISDEQRGQVETCTDLERLNTWLARAATATTAEEVFGDA